MCFRPASSLTLPPLPSLVTAITVFGVATTTTLACTPPCCVQLPQPHLATADTPTQDPLRTPAAISDIRPPTPNISAIFSTQSSASIPLDTVLDSGPPTVYTQLPEYEDLTHNQKRLAGTLSFPTLTNCPPTQRPACWRTFAWDHRPVAAIFYMVTFVLERTLVGSASLIERVHSIEGILVGDRVEHDHEGGTRCIVDGWRLHLRLNGMTDQALADFRDDDYAHPTHRVFGFTRNYRMARGGAPHLQLVLDPAYTSADSDLDEGWPMWRHNSSPSAIYAALVDRYDEVQNYLKLYRGD